VSGASLGVVRVALGVVAVLVPLRTLVYGWADSLYASPSHRFTYLGLGWVPQPGPVGIRFLLLAVAAAGTGLMVGRHVRRWAAVLVVSFGWVEAIDATTYLNHYWFVTLLAALALVAPLSGRRPVAAGWVWLFRFQVAVVYAFAGIAKLQPDWLFEALPLRLWLPARADFPVVGHLLTVPFTAHVLSVAGAAFDCLVVPGLLWRRTRPFAWTALVAFHVSTWLLFPIGVFPWLMIAVSTVFWSPDWPDRARERLNLGSGAVPPGQPGDDVERSRVRTRLTIAAAVVWVAVQIALPLRHLAYPGDHRWTAEGYRFGWNVLLVERSGSVTFIVHDPAADRTWTADLEPIYTPNQIRVMSGEPDLILQAAHTIARLEAEAGRKVEVRVDAWLSFNGRPAERWIDPTVDLAAEPTSLDPKHWILPRD